MNKKIIVERETYEKNEKTYFSYFVRGTVRGKEVKAVLSPSDFGGFTVLDLIFDINSKPQLIEVPYEFTDANGNSVKGESLAVSVTDETGEKFECKVKPNKASDKTILAMLMKL